MAAKWARSTRRISRDIKRKIIQKALSKSGSIASKGTQNIKKAYKKFKRAPIDTGDSKSKSKMTVKKAGDNLRIEGSVNTAQASFFIRGLGSNRKYGERDVITKGLLTTVPFIQSIIGLKGQVRISGGPANLIGDYKKRSKRRRKRRRR